jgi:hypothetical protein
MFYSCPEIISQESNMIGAIVGGIIGGFIFIIVLIVISIYCCRKKTIKNQPIDVAQPQEMKPLT